MLDISRYTLVAKHIATESDPDDIAIPDPTAVPGHSYAYRVIAVNTVQLKSAPSIILDASPTPASVNAPSLAGAAIYDRTTESITFKIKSESPGTRAFMIERALVPAGSAPNAVLNYVQINTVSPDTSGTTAIKDPDVLEGRQYSYRIYAIDQTGNVSKLPLIVPGTAQ